MDLNSQDKVADEFSFEREKEIALSFSKRFQWEMLSIGLGQALVWLSLWPLVMMQYMPLWVGFLVATLCACLAYLPSHEAQHGNFSRGQKKRRWIDALVGHVSLITLMYPYEVLRVTHMKHHANTNDSEKDPDYGTSHAKSLWHVALLSLDGSSTDYEKYLEVYADDKAFVEPFKRGASIYSLYRCILFALVIWFPFEALLLWWLPAKIGVLYTTVYFSWYPHQETGIGRYKDTRFWQNALPRYVTHSMQLHFVHHLHPSIGHWSEPQAIVALKPFLLARGVPGADKIPDKINFKSLIKIAD